MIESRCDHILVRCDVCGQEYCVNCSNHFYMHDTDPEPIEENYADSKD
jgi:hypothetical protein